MPQYSISISPDEAQSVLKSRDPNRVLRLDVGVAAHRPASLYVPRSALSGSPSSLSINGPVFEVWPHYTHQQIGSTNAVVENGKGVIEIKK